jgi:hypothetical protein
MRCKKAPDFFEALWAVLKETGNAALEIGHREDWDPHFAGQRG